MKIHRFFVLLRKGWAAAPGENSSAFFLPKRLVSKMSLSQLYKIKQKWENLKSGLDTGGGYGIIGTQRKGPSFETCFGSLSFTPFKEEKFIMKLKKIASLMLAGVMALSMLAGCSTNGNNNEEQPPVVDPVDTTFAASVNAELSDAQKNVITFSNDATLNSVLTKVAGVLDSESMTPYYVQGFGNVFSVDAMDMRHLLGIDEENSMVFGDRLFKDNATSTVTAADIFVVDGSYTDEGVAEFVADLVGKLISEDKMPAVANGKDYRYSYTGNIACTKVTNLAGDFQSYVVAFTVTQTPTKITNNNK